MMRGVVTTEHGALMLIIVVDSHGQSHEIEAVIDTGFFGHLMLPPEQISHLNLAPLGASVVCLAEGTNRMLQQYAATVHWDGIQREVYVLEGESDPLVGMLLLQNHRVCMDMVDGGAVTITPLSP